MTLNITNVEMDLQKNAGKQIEQIVNSSLLPSKWEMSLNDINEFYDKRFDFMQNPKLLLLPKAKRKS